MGRDRWKGRKVRLKQRAKAGERDKQGEREIFLYLQKFFEKDLAKFVCRNSRYICLNRGYTERSGFG